VDSASGPEAQSMRKSNKKRKKVRTKTDQVQALKSYAPYARMIWVV
jgi:hypothetical protein